VSIRVGIADDQALVRSGFRLIVDAREDHDVVGEAEDGRQAVALVEDLEPDVLLLDVRMPVMDGIEATRRIAASGSRTRILILTTFDVDDYVYGAIRAGASGFLLKDVRPADLVDAIRVVASGNALFGPTAVNRLVERFQPPLRRGALNDNAIAALTTREVEILRLVAAGLSMPRSRRASSSARRRSSPTSRTCCESSASATGSRP
jgi:DNA-binding NarL/FixJ family response regulator